MNCKSCKYDNLKDSDFCQNCGEKLNHKSKPEGENKPIHKEIEDIVFVPKKKSSAVKIVLIILVVLVAGWLLLVLISPEQSVTNSTNNLEDTNYNNSFTLSSLTINNADLEYSNTLIGTTTYLKGTLKNSSNKTVSYVKVRLDFTNDKSGDDVFDTRYVVIRGVAANGANTFKEVVLDFTPPTKTYYYTWGIEEAY